MNDEFRELEPGDPTSLKGGRYTPESVLGEGSMGRTYLSRDVESGQLVAVKALYPSRLADFKDLELFKREAKVLEQLDHPQIPAYIDSFHEGEGESTCYYLVQSYVEGETLRKKIVAEKRFSEAEILELASQLLVPLGYMHKQDPKVVHRDIKPDNIIISDGVPTLVDFGAVREVVRLTMRGGSTVVGSYGYMPPEQLMGRALPATDLYAVGITLLECLTRRRPGDLTGNEATKLIAQTSVSERLKRILRRLCAPLLSDRYEDADQVLQDIKKVGTGGKLVHAAKLETAIVVREKRASKALKEASKAGFHIGYVALVIFLALSGTAAIGIVVASLSASLEVGVLLAIALSALGLLINLVLASRRYIHDAWEPPKSDWIEATATLKDYVDQVDPVNDRVVRRLVTYTFPLGGSHYEASRTYFGPKGRVPVGTEFSVYYPRRKPEYHESVDIWRDGYEEMSRLYEQNKTYVPE